MVLRKQALKTKRIVQGASLVSAGLLAAAYWFEFAGGLEPCTLCLYQRIPHGVMVLLGLLSLTALRPGIVFVFMIALMVISGTLGLYHAGVEWALWSGPSGCSSSLSGMSGSEGLDQLLNTAVVRCDEVVWSFMGLSMAGWNMAISYMVAGAGYIIYRRI